MGTNCTRKPHTTFHSRTHLSYEDVTANSPFGEMSMPAVATIQISSKWQDIVKSTDMLQCACVHSLFHLLSDSAVLNLK